MQCFRPSAILAIIAACAFLVLASPPTHASSRKDVVGMNNGDRFTGEVKGLQKGILCVKMDYVADKIGVDWTQVQRLESSAAYQVTMVNGAHLIGSVQRDAPTEAKSTESNNDLLIVGTEGTTRVRASQVVDISTQKPTFLRQLTCSIDVGYSFASGNSQTTINTDANVNYATPKSVSGIVFSNSYSVSSGSSQTNRQDLTVDYSRFLSQKFRPRRTQ